MIDMLPVGLPSEDDIMQSDANVLPDIEIKEKSVVVKDAVEAIVEASDTVNENSRLCRDCYDHR